MPRLHVAVLDEELPYPLTSGKRIRSFNLLTRLAATTASLTSLTGTRIRTKCGPRPRRSATTTSPSWSITRCRPRPEPGSTPGSPEPALPAAVLGRDPRQPGHAARD